MDAKYPIKPKHLNTDDLPKGFDDILGYDQKVILWSLVEMWQFKKNWEPISVEEFDAMVNDPKVLLNKAIRTSVIRFFLEVNNVLRVEGEDSSKRTFAPTHFMICRYFAHNPAV